MERNTFTETLSPNEKVIRKSIIFIYQTTTSFQPSSADSSHGKSSFACTWRYIKCLFSCEAAPGLNVRASLCLDLFVGLPQLRERHISLKRYFNFVFCISRLDREWCVKNYKRVTVKVRICFKSEQKEIVILLS